MLLICNGAFKGGSTWLYQIAAKLPGFEPVPEAFRDPAFKNASLDLDKADAFFRTPGNYYSKQHWTQHWTGEARHREPLARPDVRMLNIVRDLGDVVVSFYYHLRRHGRFEGDFETYFHASGLRHAQRHIDYQSFWHGHGPPEPLMVSYEGLRLAFRDSALAILGYVGVAPDEGLIERLAATDVLHEANRRPVGEGSFFRKAQIGDRRNHLTPAMEAALDQLVKSRGYDALLAGVVARFPHCRHTLEVSEGPSP